MEIKIIPTRGYYSVIVNGSLYCTADTYVEAERELENDGLIQLLKTHKKNYIKNIMPKGRKEIDIMRKNVIVNRAKYDIIPDEKNIHKGKAVLCITTGEVFKSAKAAANRYGINYHSLIHQISGKYKTCGGGKNHMGDGMKFCYVAEMGYKADDISKCIIELKAKTSEINEQERRIADMYNKFMEIKANHNREMEEMMSQLMALARQEVIK